MKGRKIARKIGMILGVLFLSGLLYAAVVSAASDTGSIEARLPEYSKNVENLRLKVFQLMVQNQDGTFTWVKSFQDHPDVTLDSGNAADAQKAAEDLAAYALRQNIDGTEQTVSGDSVRFEGLPEGYYLIAQTSGQEKMVVSPSLVMIPAYEGSAGDRNYDAVITLKAVIPDGSMVLNKISDDEDPLAVPGAKFILQEKVYLADLSEDEMVPDDADRGEDEQGAFYWKQLEDGLPATDKDGKLIINDLHFGDYRLIETEAPDGYLLAEPKEKEFTISVAGDVDANTGEVSGTPEPVEVVDPATYVEVLKQDSDGNPLAGAVLTVKKADGSPILDENGELVYEFRTKEEPVPVRRLAPGEYYLTELEAPDGYEIAEDVRFEVSGEEKVTVPIVMTDKEKETTDYSLDVTKQLTTFDEEDEDIIYRLIALKDTYYVALFQDDKRVSDVKKLLYENSGIETVTFTHLLPGETYTVYETDEAGNPIDGEDNFTAIFADDQQTVTIDPANHTDEFSFDNLFFEIPEGYSYEGDITVTKQTTMDGQAFHTNNTYYVGIFTDPECTELYQLVTLEMNGASEAGMMVPVALGSSVNDVKTFYVAEVEVRDDGAVEVLENGTGLNFDITINGEKKSLETIEVNSTGNAEVTVVNDYHEPDSTPTPTPNPTSSLTPAPETPGTPGGNTPDSPNPNNPGSQTEHVRTGDDTPIGLYLGLLGAAAVIAAILLVVRRKKK